MLLVHLCHGFQLRHDAHTQCLAALCREHSVDTTSFSILRTTAVQCRAPPYVPRRSDFLRTTAVKCTEPYVPYVPSREPYVPSWAQGGSAKKNVYAEQRTEYEEYAKVIIEEGVKVAETAGSVSDTSQHHALSRRHQQPT